uniref:FAD_binding_4 domain-containing protein n=1 Tax=Strongyloides venezuelensis TaxID=75913 RepID=A0A0K0G569_STRVS
MNVISKFQKSYLLYRIPCSSKTSYRLRFEGEILLSTADSTIEQVFISWQNLHWDRIIQEKVFPNCAGAVIGGVLAHN